MKKILFAVMAIAVVVLTTGCNKNDDFLKASLSVEEVTEHSIKVRCTYVPQKKDDAGYLLLRSTTDQIDDEMRKELVELYPMVEPNHDSGVFLCDSLAADRLYYFWAVSYQRQKNGEVTIANIETLGQRTLASNDDQYSYTTSGSNVTFTVLLDDEGFGEIYLGCLYETNIAKHHVYVALTPDTALVTKDEIGDNKYYSESDSMECTVNIGDVENYLPKTFTYYAFKPMPDSMYRTYKFDVTVDRKQKQEPVVTHSILVVAPGYRGATK